MYQVVEREAETLDTAWAPSGRERTTPARDTLVIVGNGMVGHRLCTRLAELGAMERFAVVVFGEERMPAYDRVHLTELITGRTEASLLMSPRHWYEERGIDLRLGDPVIAIDRAQQVVRSASGATVPYNRLVLATGSSAFVPAMEGRDLTGVFVYRTIDDLRRIREYGRLVRSAAVIGGGLLGLEAARALQYLGLQVTVVELSRALMANQLDNDGAAILADEISALGIRLMTGTMTSRIEHNGETLVLNFADGGTLAADMIVVAAGIRPRAELAVLCDLSLGASGAVRVDDRLQTSDPHIYAIGECASHRSRVYGLVAPGYEMADALARNLMGESASFTGSDMATRLKLLEVDVATAGDPLERGAAVRFTTGGIYRLLRIDRGRLIGALGIGAWPEFNHIHERAMRRARIWPWQVARFQRTGHIWRGAVDVPVVDWPATAIVCNCLTITRGQLAAACASGCQTAESLSVQTSAGTLCGSCRPLLAELAVPNAASLRAPIGRGLLSASIVGLATLAGLFAGPIPFVNTVEGSFHVDVLWRTGLYRQITGFVLLGLCALALLLTARKRWRRLSFGSFAAWRIVHAVVGVLALGALVAHTGLRLGHNLNLALMTTFLLLNIVGVLAGGVTAVEGQMARRVGMKWRPVLVLAHIVAFWPLPVLVTFHVLAVYYF